MNDNKPVLMAVLAHPDDESFGLGGTLALYAQRGAQVHLICATRGESGEVDPDHMQGFDSVADRRMFELKCAASILGLQQVHFLDYCDSGMLGSPQNKSPDALVNAPLSEVTAKIVHLMRELKPQVVLTFDPVGGYGHPDHITVHKAALEAFYRSGDENFKDDLEPYQPQKLYFHVIPREMLRFAVRIMPVFGKDPHHFGRNKDIDLVSLVAGEDFPIHVRVNFQPVKEKKDQAAECHSSQLVGGVPRRGPISWILRWYGRHEHFMRAVPEARLGLRERDLFEGIQVDWS